MAISADCDKTAVGNYIDFLSNEVPETKSIVLMPDGSLKPKSRIPQLLRAADGFLDKANNPLAALDCYTAVLLISPDYRKAHVVRYKRALAWKQLKEGVFVMHEADKAIELSSDYPDPHDLRGTMYSRSGRPKLALADYSKALALDPNRPKILYRRGMTYLRMKNYEKSVKDFTAAIQLAENHLPAYYMRARAYRGLRDTKAAVADLEQILKLKPNFRKARVLLRVIRQENR